MRKFQNSAQHFCAELETGRAMKCIGRPSAFNGFSTPYDERIELTLTLIVLGLLAGDGTAYYTILILP